MAVGGTRLIPSAFAGTPIGNNAAPVQALVPYIRNDGTRELIAIAGGRVYPVAIA